VLVLVRLFAGRTLRAIMRVWLLFKNERAAPQRLHTPWLVSPLGVSICHQCSHSAAPVDRLAVSVVGSSATWDLLLGSPKVWAPSMGARAIHGQTKILYRFVLHFGNTLSEFRTLRFLDFLLLGLLTLRL